MGFQESCLKNKNKLADELTLPLTIAYQQSIHQKKIPDIWRLAHIVPLYKRKGDKSSVSSYRPISLTNIESKLLEGIVTSQIKSFWRSNNLICEEQHGFLWHRSTVFNLAACDTKIVEILNEQNACDVFLLDFARAFDKVPHSVVLQKMRALSGHPFEWLADFLCDRSQCVLYGGVTSSLSPVLSGIIQGSILGPTLFTGVINDLPSQLETCNFFFIC